MTNCITEIPQDIKLELTNGTLVLKSGSILYKPSGFESDGTTRKFDRIIVETDVDLLLTLTSTYFDGDYSWCYNKDLNKIQGGNNKYNQIQSLQYDGTAQCCMFYDIDNNIIKYTDDTGITWESGYSLPFGLTTLANGVGNTSIDQVFNGFGYIGSTVFSLPGVKGLIPNGRDEDGSLKNISYTTSQVQTYSTTASAYNFGLYLDKLGDLFYTTKVKYDEVKNVNYSSVLSDRYCYRVGSLTTTNGIISNLKIRQPFNGVDRSFLSSLSMPSSKYIDLTLGASGSTYTAPANGWVFVEKAATATGQILIINSANGELIFCAASSSQSVSCVYPVKRGMSFLVNYSTAGETKYFRLIYAEGEV